MSSLVGLFGAASPRRSDRVRYSVLGWGKFTHPIKISVALPLQVSECGPCCCHHHDGIIADADIGKSGAGADVAAPRK